jgi:hypothetical protein
MVMKHDLKVIRMMCESNNTEVSDIGNHRYGKGEVVLVLK